MGTLALVALLTPPCVGSWVHLQRFSGSGSCTATPGTSAWGMGEWWKEGWCHLHTATARYSRMECLRGPSLDPEAEETSHAPWLAPPCLPGIPPPTATETLLSTATYRALALRARCSPHAAGLRLPGMLPSSLMRPATTRVALVGRSGSRTTSPWCPPAPQSRQTLLVPTEASLSSRTSTSAPSPNSPLPGQLLLPILLLLSH